MKNRFTFAATLLRRIPATVSGIPQRYANMSQTPVFGVQKLSDALSSTCDNDFIRFFAFASAYARHSPRATNATRKSNVSINNLHEPSEKTGLDGCLARRDTARR